MEKINVAELLKDCPSGMELDCTIWDNVTLVHVNNEDIPFPITLSRKNDDGSESYFVVTKYGQYYSDSKCVIFPKGKTTWEGFQIQFEDGDILKSRNGSIFIYNKSKVDGYGCYCGFDTRGKFIISEGYSWTYSVVGFATEEEKQELFGAIRAAGYRWNAETKTLEKLPKFKVGDSYEIQVRDGQTFAVKKGSLYPKTYKECCKVLSLGEDGKLYTKGYKASLIQDFQKLFICRNAYWKIAGNWEPEFRFGKKKYCIMTKDNKVISATVEETNRVFVFPTEEMRGAFYENFKDLIEECKELL